MIVGVTILPPSRCFAVGVVGHDVVYSVRAGGYLGVAGLIYYSY
jgi:hypothetical protein